MSAADEDERDSIPMNVEDEKSKHDEEDDEGVPPPFLPEQRVLCKDNDTTYYQAVVRKVRCVSVNEWNFFVHYLGWNSRWDRWEDKETLVFDTPDNRKQYLTSEEPAPASQQQSQQPSSSSQSKTKRKGQAESSSAKRRKSDTSSSTISYYQEYCELPFTLKTILVEEYEKITRQGFDAPHGYDCEIAPRPARSVHQLPATVSISQILQHYQRKRGGSSVPQEKQEEVSRFCQALQSLFDEALPVCVLYPQEQPQYQAILLLQQKQNSESSKSLSEIYGCEFLLRFLVRLPVLLQAEPDMESSLTFGPLITDLIVLLQKNRQACFKGSYREPKDDELLDWEMAALLRANDNDTTAPQTSSPSTKTINSMER
jgi:mortality factor 4-like protein 1